MPEQKAIGVGVQHQPGQDATDRPRQDATDRPRPEWVRGICPDCGDELVSNCYHIASRGYLVTHDCWSSLSATPTCSYRKVINPPETRPINQ